MPPTMNEQIEQKAIEIQNIAKPEWVTTVTARKLAKYVKASEIQASIDALNDLEFQGQWETPIAMAINAVIDDHIKRLQDQLSQLEGG